MFIIANGSGRGGGWCGELKTSDRLFLNEVIKVKVRNKSFVCVLNCMHKTFHFGHLNLELNKWLKVCDLLLS